MADIDSTKKSFWNFKKYEEMQWFNSLAVLLILLCIFYIVIHFTENKFSKKNGYEYVKLDKEQMQQINRIYFDTPQTALQRNTEAGSKTDSLKKDIKKNKSTNLSSDSLNKIIADSLKIIDSLDSIKLIHTNKTKIDTSKLECACGTDTSKSDSCYCSDCTTTGRVICFLWNEFNHKLETSQLCTIKNYLKCASPTQATNFLNNQRLQIKSYFWLTGPLVYMEIIFWAWFGVICSLLFNLGIIGKNSTTNPTDPTTYFDSSEIPSQIAKLLYAPACTLIIVLGYNFFNDQNIVDISSSKGVIVFAFIGGFYSSRLVAFLDKLKEILLPVSSTTGITKSPPLRNIVIQVQFDTAVTNLWESLKGDLKSLSVTLQEENSTTQAKAININQNQWPLFIFDFVKPGTYTVQATWTTKQNDVDINFKAEQKIEMKTTDQFVTLVFNKA